MSEDETLRALFDADAPASAPNLSELRARLVAHIDGFAAQSDSGTESVENLATARTSDPASGIQGEHEDSTNRGQNDEGQPVTDSDGQSEDYDFDPGASSPPHVVAQGVYFEIAADIDSAGSDDALERVHQYALIVDDVEFAQGLDHFYQTHDFPEELHGAVRRLQAHRGITPRRFPTETPLRTGSPSGRQRVAIARAVSPDPAVLLLDEPTSGLSTRGPFRFWGIGIIGFVILGVTILGLLWFFVFRGGGGSDTQPIVTPATTSIAVLPPATVETTIPLDDPEPEAADPTVPPDDPEPEAADPTVPPDDAVAIELSVPLYIVLNDASQYPVWGLESPDGSVIYVLVVPPRSQGCLLVSFGGNDVDTVGTCDLTQIGTSQPATVLYSADDGSVIIELRNPDVVNLTDEVGFAQSAIVAVRDAPIVDRAEQLLIFGTMFAASS